jgi:hypothetical protein
VGPGTPVWVTGKIEGALQLPGGAADGGIGQYVVLPRNLFATLTETTVAVWFRWEGGPLNQRVFDMGSGIPYWFFFSPGFSDGARVGVSKGVPSHVFYDIHLPLLTPETWTHVAITWSAASMDVYVDGVRRGNWTPPLVAPQDLGGPTLSWLGRSQFEADPYYAGMLDEFRIYDRALSAVEVEALHEMDQ